MKSSAWKIVFPPSARREIVALPKSVQIEAFDIIEGLTEDPRPSDALRLRGHKNVYRIRFYARRSRPLYRLIYEVFDSKRTVRIWRVRRRGPDTYSGL